MRNPVETADINLFWLTNLVIQGREEDEGDNSGEDDESNDSENSGEEDENSNEDDGNDGDGEGDDSSDNSEEVRKLREALKNERQAHRRTKREQKNTRNKKKEEDEEKGEEALQRERTRSQQLAATLRTRSIDSAIKEVARNMNFIDPTDALTDAVRKQVDVDQDDDDPSDIEVDMDSVKDALEELAEKKAHLIRPSGDTKSGGKFHRKQGKGGGGKTNLTDHYPSLR